jgi:hypothetical protein
MHVTHVCNARMNVWMYVHMYVYMFGRTSVWAYEFMWDDTFWVVKLCSWSKHTVVRIAKRHELDGWISITDRSKRFFSTPNHQDLFWDPHSRITRVQRGRLYTRLKQPGRESELPPPSSVLVKNDEAIQPLSNASSCFAVQLIEHKETFIILKNIFKPFSCTAINRKDRRT